MSDMSGQTKTVFYSRSWYLYVPAVVFSMLALFCATLGPLFFSEVIKRDDGEPGIEAGIAMSVMAIPMGLMSAFSWFNVIVRCKPLVRICSEGVEINVIGVSSLDGVPLLPNLVRVAWLIVSLQGFQQQIGWIPWERFRSVKVSGLPMMRSLVIDGTIFYRMHRGDERTVGIDSSVAFRDAAVQEKLEVIAATIQCFYEDPNSRSILPSLQDYRKKIRTLS